MATLRTAVSTILPKTSSLTQSLTTASKVAHMFDWKKSSNHILTLHITKQAIECAIASHPTLTQRSSTSNSSIWNGLTKTASPPPFRTLPSIPLSRDVTVNRSPYNRATPSFHVTSVTKALQDVIQDYSVCGIVVVYPTNTDNGCNNAACGRVLHVLDHISLTGNNNTSKPICLYDPNTHHHHSEQLLPDEWGRSPLYSTTTTAKEVHCAKQPQSEPGNSTILQQTWYNFVRQYWPNIRTLENDDEYDFNDFEDDDLSDFLTQLSQKKLQNNVTTFHMNKNSTIGDNHNKKNLVYQSAF
jgi:hypothetical protein